MRDWFIIGGAGFVGRAIGSALLARGDARVTIGSRSAPADRAKGNLRFVLYDDLSDLDLDDAARADVIVDLASPGRGRFATRHDLGSRVAGHIRLVDGLANRGWGGHLLFASSGGTIYGSGFACPMYEDWPRQPMGEYALEKAVVEMHLQTLAYHGALASTTLRVSNVYGPLQPIRPGFGVVPAIAQALRDGTPFRRFGHGRSVRDYVHIDDVVDAMIRAGDRQVGGVLNIGSGFGTSLDRLIVLSEELSGRSLSVQNVHVPPGEPDAIVLDCTRAAERLDWRAEVTIEDGLRHTFDHHGLGPQTVPLARAS